jgi:DNA-directed RNA polymerase specialized sigma24 family protein
MAKKRSDEEEVQSRWHQFIKGVEVDPALQSFFQRHHGVGEEPRTFFEAVGEDLASSREDIREQAFWLLVAGMPELADILHERETRQPGWRSGAGKGQQVIDRGLDIVTYLYRNLVKEHQFKTDQGKDPRSYVRRTARNWSIDATRKDSRTVLSLDEPLNNEGITLGSSLAASLPDPTSVEDEVVDELYYEQGLQQIRTWNFLQDEELGWFAEIYIAKHPLDSVAAQFDIPAKEAARVRQRKSRARQKALKRLESTVVWYLLNVVEECRSMYLFQRPTFDLFVATRSTNSKELLKEFTDWFVVNEKGFPKFVPLPKNLLDSWLWKWAKRAVYLRAGNEGVIYEHPDLVVRSLTQSFDGRPGHLFLMSPPTESVEKLKVFRMFEKFDDYRKHVLNTCGWEGLLQMEDPLYRPKRFVGPKLVLDLPGLDCLYKFCPTFIYDPSNIIRW